MEWQKINKETAAATYDSVRNTYSEDGTLTEDGLRLVIEEAKKANKKGSRGLHKRRSRFFDSQTSTKRAWSEIKSEG